MVNEQCSLKSIKKHTLAFLKYNGGTLLFLLEEISLIDVLPGLQKKKQTKNIPH